jgi:hypothetical protein
MDITYKYETIQLECEFADLQKHLNKYGAKGWSIEYMERVGGQNYDAGTGGVTAPIYHIVFKQSEISHEWPVVTKEELDKRIAEADAIMDEEPQVHNED